MLTPKFNATAMISKQLVSSISGYLFAIFVLQCLHLPASNRKLIIGILSKG